MSRSRRATAQLPEDVTRRMAGNIGGSGHGDCDDGGRGQGTEPGDHRRRPDPDAHSLTLTLGAAAAAHLRAQVCTHRRQAVDGSSEQADRVPGEQEGHHACGEGEAAY